MAKQRFWEKKGTANDPKSRALSVKHGWGVVIAWACMGASGTVTNLVATHHISCTTLQLHITHGLHFPSTIAPITQLSPITHFPDCLTTPAPHSHTHISSTLPCTHCEVLFSPVWHFQAVSLSVFPCVYLDCLYDSDRLLPAFWPCLPFDVLSVCRLPWPLHCPCCWFCLAFVTPITVSEPCLFDLLLFINKAAFGSNDTASSLQEQALSTLLIT